MIVGHFTFCRDGGVGGVIQRRFTGMELWFPTLRTVREEAQSRFDCADIRLTGVCLIINQSEKMQ